MLVTLRHENGPLKTERILFDEWGMTQTYRSPGFPGRFKSVNRRNPSIVSVYSSGSIPPSRNQNGRNQAARVSIAYLTGKGLGSFVK